MLASPSSGCCLNDTETNCCDFSVLLQAVRSRDTAVVALYGPSTAAAMGVTNDSLAAISFEELVRMAVRLFKKPLAVQTMEKSGMLEALLPAQHLQLQLQQHQHQQFVASSMHVEQQSGEPEAAEHADFAFQQQQQQQEPGGGNVQMDVDVLTEMQLQLQQQIAAV